MANRRSMPLLTELEEFNGRLAAINISLLVELVECRPGSWAPTKGNGEATHPRQDRHAIIGRR
jgi:hypothetical protein